MKRIPGPYTVMESHTILPAYDRKPEYDEMKWDRDVMVRMRDGVHLCVDVYRPGAPGKFPALLAISIWNKDLQTPDATENNGPQPAWSPFWFGGQEAGDSRFLTSRGYAHIIGNPRGIGKSEDNPPGQPPMASNMDFYDLIEWVAAQPWCDGNVGMIGISAFAGTQWQAAMQEPPHLKAIFPYDAFFANRYRDMNPGGVLQTMSVFIGSASVEHENRGRPVPLSPELEKLWEKAMNNPDYRMYGNLYNILTMKGQRDKETFYSLIDPYEAEDAVKIAEENSKKIKIPTYTGAGWYAYTYKVHLEGCQAWYEGIKVPKKLLFPGLAHLERPFHSIHSEILRWYDYWLKGINTGIMDEPAVKMWVMGANAWYEAGDWPVPETKWTKYYLQSWERLREEPFLPSSREGIEQPDAFVQMPPSQTRQVQKLRYLTDPLPEDVMIAGPSALYLHASIDQEDTNWIVILKDVGPDESIRTGREGETLLRTDLPERELVRGWLKASHRTLDSERSKPWKPWHPFTSKAAKPVVPGDINEYAIEILSTANLFEKGHRICLEITSTDIPTGSAGLTNVEYIPYHVCSSKIVLHKIYHNEKYSSYLLLPVIPRENLSNCVPLARKSVQ